MSATPDSGDRHLVRLLVIVLLGSWLAGTALVLQANAIAPTAPPTAVDLARLPGAWGWYAAGYALFFIADGCIALLGAVLLVWLRLQGSFRGLAILVLFTLSGVLGVLADLQMLGAAQVFRLGSPALNVAWLDNLNTSGNWLSGASFLPCGVAAWLACGAARDAGVGRGWIAFTEFGAVYQIATGLISVAAFLTGQALLTDIALLAAIIGSPIFVTVWLTWMMREMSTFPNRRQPS